MYGTELEGLIVERFLSSRLATHLTRLHGVPPATTDVAVGGDVGVSDEERVREQLDAVRARVDALYERDPELAMRLVAEAVRAMLDRGTGNAEFDADLRALLAKLEEPPLSDEPPIPEPPKKK
jgi:hypothetical protein